MTDLITNPVANGKVQKFDSESCITMVKFNTDNNTNDTDENRNNTEYYSGRKKEDLIEVCSISSGDSASVATENSQSEQSEDSVPQNQTIAKSKSSSMNEADLEGHGRPKLVRRNSKTSYHGSTHDEAEAVSESRREEMQFLRHRSCSVIEHKEHAQDRLEKELQLAQEELKLKDEECKKLSRIREQMSEEIEELTASLFEEANKMVQDAHVRRMHAEKILKEANAKIDILQAEVTALKTLVITSTPNTPNSHMHPQLDSKKSSSSSPKTPMGFIKGHRRSTSHHNISREISLKEIIKPIEPLQPTPASSRSSNDLCGQAESFTEEQDDRVYTLFKDWRLKPSLVPSCPLLQLFMREDILPGLHFSNQELAKSVLEGVLSNTLIIEPVHEKDPGPRKCSLMEQDRVCKHRMKIRDNDSFHYISSMARNRVTAVCNFYTYIRYIVQGLVKSSDKAMFAELNRLRKETCLAKLGFSSS